MDSKENIQARLNAFYQQALGATNFDSIQRTQLSQPLLLSVPQAYLDSPLRVMFVGKETNGWIGKLDSFDGSEAAIFRLLDRYDDQMRAPTAKGAFTSMHHKISDTLSDGRKESVLWNNLMKMDWYQGQSSGRNSIKHSEELRKLSRQMLQFEVELLKPHVILFGTGPTYDSAIKTTFPIQNSRRIVPRALWFFESNGIVCYRMQHPQARSGKNSILQPVDIYYKQALADVRERFAAHLSS